MDFVSDVAQIEADDAAWAQEELDKGKIKDGKPKPWYKKIFSSI